MLINFVILQEKDQQKKQKEKLTKNGLHGGKGPPGGLTSLTVGNQHNASAYFNHSLDDIIQGLNHMIPLFVEKCVYFIETHGKQSFLFKLRCF